MDRLDGIINFRQHKDPNSILNDWSHNISTLMQLVNKTNHLITKEEMVHKLHWMVSRWLVATVPFSLHHFIGVHFRFFSLQIYIHSSVWQVFQPSPLLSLSKSKLWLTTLLIVIANNWMTNWIYNKNIYKEKELIFFIQIFNFWNTDLLSWK